MNLFAATGNLGKDCRKGNSGDKAVLNFSIGVKSGFGDKEQTLWVDCALWGKQAESKLADYLVKGQKVAVTGELGTREHDGKLYLTLRVASIDLCGGKSESNSGGQSAQQARPAQTPKPTANPATDYDSFDDDIPF
jgi:single-strand DNA-binding protein